MSKKWQLGFFLMFLFFTLCSFLYPPFNSDSVRYSLPGNPFFLQWLDYTGQNLDGGAFQHGRYLTHTFLRLILQAGEPWLNFFMGIVLTFILGVYLNAVQPGYYKGEEPSSFYTAALLFVLMVIGPRTFMYYWFVHAHPLNNFLSMALILCFLAPYEKLLPRERGGRPASCF